MLVRVPAFGVGLFIALNEATVGNSIKFIVLYRLLDDLFQLEPIDWEKRILTDFLKAGPGVVEAPSHPRNPPPSIDIVGRYHSEGYSELEIVRMAAAPSLDPESDQVEGMWEEGIPINESRPTDRPAHYVAKLPTIYDHGFILSHHDGPVFNATLFAVRMQPNGRSLVVKDPFPTFSVVFDGSKGVGMFGNFWDGETALTPVEEDIPQNAEVWFAKLP